MGTTRLWVYEGPRPHHPCRWACWTALAAVCMGSLLLPMKKRKCKPPTGNIMHMHERRSQIVHHTPTHSKRLSQKLQKLGLPP